MIKESEFNKFSEKDRMNRVLEGTSFWARVQTPVTSEKYKNSKFTVMLGLDEANIKLAESFGLKVNPADKNVPMPYVEIRRKVTTGKSAAEVKPSIVDSQQKPVPATILIGNNSKIKVKFGTYWSGDQAYTNLWKVMILELVEFKANNIDRQLGTKEGGFVVSSSAEPTPETSIEFDDDDGFHEPEKV